MSVTKKIVLLLEWAVVDPSNKFFLGIKGNPEISVLGLAHGHSDPTIKNGDAIKTGPLSQYLGRAFVIAACAPITMMDLGYQGQEHRFVLHGSEYGLPDLYREYFGHVFSTASGSRYALLERHPKYVEAEPKAFLDLIEAFTKPK